MKHLDGRERRDQRRDERDSLGGGEAGGDEVFETETHARRMPEAPYVAATPP